LNDIIRIPPKNGCASNASFVVSCSYGVGHAEPPMNPPPPAGKFTVALPVGVPLPLLFGFTNAMTAAVSPAAPP
jgi:hypothetical protein